jgi:CRP/FNR family transcriptional regulator
MNGGNAMNTVAKPNYQSPPGIYKDHAQLETNIIPLHRSGLQTACSRCNQCELCPPAGLVQLDTVIGGRVRIKRGQHLYRSGESFDAIYVVTSGFFKTAVLTEDGRDQVTGFQMAGEILGMDGIDTELHSCNAVALEDSEVCRILFADLVRLSSKVPTLQHHLHKIMSREIVRDHAVIMLLGTMRAEERLAAFLLSLSHRLEARGYSSRDFHLRMTRTEIGSYLGLKQETVSRGFSRLQEEGAISKQNRHIRILDLPGLKKLTAHISSNSQRFVSTPALQRHRPLLAEDARWFQSLIPSFPIRHNMGPIPFQ